MHYVAILVDVEVEFTCLYTNLDDIQISDMDIDWLITHAQIIKAYWQRQM